MQLWVPTTIALSSFTQKRDTLLQPTSSQPEAHASRAQIFAPQREGGECYDILILKGVACHVKNKKTRIYSNANHHQCHTTPARSRISHSTQKQKVKMSTGIEQTMRSANSADPENVLHANTAHKCYPVFLLLSHKPDTQGPLRDTRVGAPPPLFPVASIFLGRGGIFSLMKLYRDNFRYATYR